MISGGPQQFGAFIAPYHDPRGNPALQLEQDLALAEQLDRDGFDEVWFGEHHSGAYEISGSPEVMIAAASRTTRRIRLGTGVSSLAYHHPLVLADRIVQLDHLTQGRVMFGIGPGQLPMDAHMMGVDPRAQRQMMIESAEAIVALLRGEVVTRRTSWFTLDEARVQLRAYNPRGIDVAVASLFSPTGATLAGRLGLGILSMAATDPNGFNSLDSAWGILEQEAARHGHVPDRRDWRVVAPLHLAETREQAEADVERGILTLVAYLERLANRKAAWSATARQALERWQTKGIPTFGRITTGTPDDAVATIRALTEKTGGFGTLLVMSLNCADWEATQRSYRLFAEYVIPEVRGMNVARQASIDWAGARADELAGGMTAAIQEAVERHAAPAAPPA